MITVWENKNTNERLSERPIRIRLPDGFTRTNLDITDEQLAEAGWELKQYESLPLIGPPAIVIE